MNERPDDDFPTPGPDSGGSKAGRASLGVALGRLIGVRKHMDEALVAASCFRESESVTASFAGGSAASELRRVLPDIYFVNTPAERTQRHAEMLSHLAPEARAPLIDFHSAQGLPLTECTLCAFDDLSPGLLAKLCGTFAALNLSIHTAFIYTLRLRSVPSGEAGAREILLAPASAEGQGSAVALNTFLVSESYFGHDRALTPKTQRRLRAELCRVLSGQASVPKMLARRSPTFQALSIHDLAVENRGHEEQTRILLRTGDSFGVLYRATSVLAELQLDIANAQVSTREAAADDLFFVTRGGAKLPEDELPSIAATLRAKLQSEP